MKKTKFTNQTFFWSLTALITFYLTYFSIPSIYLFSKALLNSDILYGYGFWNSFDVITNIIVTFQYGIIEVLLLILLFDKHRYTKQLIKIWAVLFLIIIPFFGVFRHIYLHFSSHYPLNILIQGVLLLLSSILAGFIILHYTKKTVVVEEVEKKNL